jgi:hypothetical protein
MLYSYIINCFRGFFFFFLIFFPMIKLRGNFIGNKILIKDTKATIKEKKKKKKQNKKEREKFQKLVLG